MKRNGKLIALALALAMCLLLTGCYVAPDDVSNSGETNPGNNLPFQTLQPTETVTMTPDTVVVETPDQSQQGQNVFPSQATPTPAPSEAGLHRFPPAERLPLTRILRRPARRTPFRP